MKYVGLPTGLSAGLYPGRTDSRFWGAILPLKALYFIYGAAVDWVVSNNLLFLNLLPVEGAMLELAVSPSPGDRSRYFRQRFFHGSLLRV